MKGLCSLSRSLGEDDAAIHKLDKLDAIGQKNEQTIQQLPITTQGERSLLVLQGEKKASEMHIGPRRSPSLRSPQNFWKRSGGKGWKLDCLVRFILPRILFSFFWEPTKNISNLINWKEAAGIFEYLTFNSRFSWNYQHLYVRSGLWRCVKGQCVCVCV